MFFGIRSGYLLVLNESSFDTGRSTIPPSIIKGNDSWSLTKDQSPVFEFHATNSTWHLTQHTKVD
jgi:hypothetical protein